MRMQLWVFTPDLFYSSPTMTGRAMKVFYRIVDNGSSISNHGSTRIEELPLPHEALREMRESFQSGTNILPPSGRNYKEWNVSLLLR